MARWFTDGYTYYFWNCPDWQGAAFHYVRPFANLTFLSFGAVADHIGDVAYLLPSYLIAVTCVGLFAVALRLYTNLTALQVAVVAVAFGLSSIWYASLWQPSFVTNTLATLFALIMLIVLNPRQGIPHRWRLAICIGCMVAAILSHETALMLPLVAVALLYGMATTRPSIRQLLPYGIPFLVFALSRIILSAPDGTYLPETTISTYVDMFGRFAPGALVPFGVLGDSTKSDSALNTVALAVSVVTNIAAAAVLLLGVRQRPPWRAAALLAAVLAAIFPGYWMSGEPRHMGFGFAATLIVILYVTARMPLHRAALIGLILITNMLAFSIGVTGQASGTADFALRAGASFNSIVSAIRDSRPDAVVLVNDVYGQHGALAMLRLANRTADHEADAVVLNALVGAPTEGASVRVLSEDGGIVIENNLMPGQEITVFGCRPSNLPNGGFRYEPLQGAAGSSSFRATGATVGQTVLVVGIDPGSGEPITHLWSQSPD